MAALIGRHNNKIDKKGRVSVPKQFRDALSETESETPRSVKTFRGIYLYCSFKYRAIEGCGYTFIRRVIDSLDNFELFSDEQDDLATTLLENSFELPFDTEGRVLIPLELIEYAGISSEVVFVGRGTHFQMWQPSAYKIHNKQAFESARARGATLRLSEQSISKKGLDL